jgi:DnaJ-class molecular chaperone
MIAPLRNPSRPCPDCDGTGTIDCVTHPMKGAPTHKWPCGRCDGSGQIGEAL